MTLITIRIPIKEGYDQWNKSAVRLALFTT